MTAILIASSLLLGLLGSSHCVLMCGGVVAMTCSTMPSGRRGHPVAQLPYVVAYNAGRVASYALAGAVAGGVGATAASFPVVDRLQLVLRLAAAVLVMGVGLYVAGFARPIRWLERAGAPIWRRLAPVARMLVPIRTPLHALALGLLWGWMPCGLVYAALGAAVTSGSAVAGATTMAAFGLGTFPMLLAMGSGAALVARVARTRALRVAAAVTLVGFGVFQLGHVARAWAAAPGSPHACCASRHS